MTLSLAAKLLEINARFGKARIPHAFGGAIALAYCTGEPRGTIDLDINVFVGIERADDVFDALVEVVKPTKTQRQHAEQEGQVRVWWDDTPLDIFFSYHPIHERVAARIRHVPFEDTVIPVLGCTDLVVFKALFGRTKDWADIEAATVTGSVDRVDAMATVSSLVGVDNDATKRLTTAFDEAIRPANTPSPLGRPKKRRS